MLSYERLTLHFATRAVLHRQVRPERDLDAHGEAAGRGAPCLEAMVGAVERQQSRARVPETDAVAVFRSRIFADTVVDDTELETVVVSRRCHDDVAGRRAGRDAVADGVLDERLQHEIGYERVTRVRVDSKAHREPVLEPDLLNLDVVRKQLQLSRERDFLLARTAQRHTQQLTQSGHNALRRVAVGADERVDGVERVEEEVGMQLETQALQLCARESRL